MTSREHEEVERAISAARDARELEERQSWEAERRASQEAEQSAQPWAATAASRSRNARRIADALESARKRIPPTKTVDEVEAKGLLGRKRTVLQTRLGWSVVVGADETLTTDSDHRPTIEYQLLEDGGLRITRRVWNYDDRSYSVFDGYEVRQGEWELANVEKESFRTCDDWVHAVGQAVEDREWWLDVNDRLAADVIDTVAKAVVAGE